MRLVERDEQVRYLDRLVDECRERRGQIVLLNGPATTGKTELLRVCADRAPEDVRVLRATCSRAEQSLPFGVLSQLLRSDTLPGELTARVDRLLRNGACADAPARPDHDAVEAALVRIVHGLGVAVLDLAAETPLLIAVDDVQHADVPSLHCLLYIARRLGSARVLVVLTDEAECETQHSSFRAELRRQPHFHQLRLAPLTREGVAAMLHGGAGTPATDTPLTDTRTDAILWDTDAFFRASGGNPLLLHALIEDRHIAGAPRAEGYGLALLSCLYRDRPAVLQVVRALAVLGDAGADDELSQLTGLDTETVSRALHDLDAAGLIDKRAFRHPVARAAVVDDISPQDRLALHRRAAQLMHDRGAPTMTVARHLVEARHTHGPWAVRVLLEAAEQAMLGEDPQMATECLKLAHRSSSDEQDRPAIRARLAQAEWELSPSAAARHLTPLVAAVRGGLLGHGDRLVLLRHLLWHGRTDEAETVLGHLRGTAGDQRPESRDEPHDIERWLAATHPPLARRSRHPHTRGGDTGHLLTPLSDPWWRSAADLGDLITRGPDQQAADRAEQILAETGVGRRSPWTEEAVQLALSVLIWAGRPGSAADWCDRLNDPAPRQTPVRTATLAAMRAEAAIRQGDLRAGADHARQALTHLAPKAWGVAIGLPLGSLVLAATRTGDYEEAAQCLTHSANDAMFHSRYGLHYLHARGHYHLATSHPHAALADFLSCGELMRAWDLDASALIPWRTGASEAWLRLGNPDQAKRLVYDELTRAGADDPRARGSALRLLAALGPVSRQPELLTEALDLLEDCGDGYEQARVLVDLCRSYRALDEHRRARMVFRRASHVTKLCNAGPLNKELTSASGDVGGFETAPVGADGITSLTGSERRVAALAVMGCTNREIAGKLHITASTVEQHLTRVYRKLNVKRRKDLPVDLRNDGATTERTPLGRR